LAAKNSFLVRISVLSKMLSHRFGSFRIFFPLCCDTSTTPADTGTQAARPTHEHAEPDSAAMADADYERKGMRLSTHGLWYKDISLNESFSGKMSFVELRGETAEVQHARKSAVNTVSHADVRVGDAYLARKERAQTEGLARSARHRDASALMCDKTARLLQQADKRAFNRIALLEEQAAEAVAGVNKAAQMRQQQQARGSSRSVHKSIQDDYLQQNLLRECRDTAEERDNQQQGRREFLEAASNSTTTSESVPRAGPSPQSSRENTSHCAWAHESFALTPRSWGVAGKGMKDHPGIDVAQSRLTKGRQTTSMRKSGVSVSQEGIFSARGERENIIAQERAMLESSGSVTSRTLKSAGSPKASKVSQQETRVERGQGPSDRLQGSMTHDGASSAVQDAALCLERESDLSDAVTSVGTHSGADSDAIETATPAASSSDNWWDDVIHWVEDRLFECRILRVSG